MDSFFWTVQNAFAISLHRKICGNCCGATATGLHLFCQHMTKKKHAAGVFLFDTQRFAPRTAPRLAGFSWTCRKNTPWFFPQNRRHYGIFKRGPYRSEAADRFHAPQAPGNAPNPSPKRAAGAVQVPNHPGGAPHQSLRNCSAFN